MLIGRDAAAPRLGEPGQGCDSCRVLAWLNSCWYSPVRFAFGPAWRAFLPTLSTYCPKYPEISIIMCVRLLANALIDPLVVGTIARFEVIAPSGNRADHQRID